MIFRRAIRRLTLAYTAAQLVLFGAFALAVYFYVTGTFDFDTAEVQGEGGLASAEQSFATLKNALIVIYAGLLLVVPITSWLMARAAMAPVRRSYELQQRFVDGASHEMRTPLAVVQGELELALTRSRTPAEYERAIRVAADATAGLVRLTNDLLLLSRGESSELALGFTEVDLNTLVSDAAAEASARQPALAPIVLDPSVGEPGVGTDGVRLQASEELLRRAVGNLIDNARKFSAVDDAVRVSIRLLNANAIVEVHDDGIGMSRTELAHARDRFWRAEAARSREGHGLGLALVDEIARAHGGSLSIRSELGAGTVATLRLPLR
ncbi:two-component sensor histidine kinase [marine actinobacterium PHSC20C1]|nr:two-component sensor histidine kinase [marine actinobacterium PHSC20C1]